MYFINPFVLFGLLAAAVPLMLHFFNLRKLKTVEFSTLRFLKQIQKTRIRRLRLRQWLLLALRMLAVIFLVFAFSRPTLRGTLPAGLGATPQSAVVLILDDSKSVAVDDPLLDRIKRSALSVSATMKEGDEFTVIPLSSLPSDPSILSGEQIRELFPILRRKESVERAIGSVTASPVRRPLDHAVRLSGRLLSSSRLLNKELVVVSDFQRGVFDTLVSAAERLFPQGTRFFSVPVPHSLRRNAGILGLTIKNSILEKGAPFIASVSLVNSGAERLTNFIVSISLSGVRSAQKGVTLAPGESVSVEFSLIPKTTGQGTILVELESDDVPFDNSRELAFSVPALLNVLVAGEQDEILFLRAALETRRSGDSVGIKSRFTTPSSLPSLSFSGYDAVILSAGTRFPSGAMPQLRRFIESGGGVLLFPSSGVTARAYTDLVSRFLPISLPEAIDSFRKAPSPELAEQFRNAELNHPLFTGMFDSDRQPEKRGVEQPRITAMFRFRPSPASRPLLVTSSGEPFLLEYAIGNGTILQWSVPPDVRWSNFPLTPLFVPLILRSVSYVAQRDRASLSLSAGDEFVWETTGVPAAPVRLTMPDGTETPLSPLLQPMRTLYRTNATRQIGIYQLRSGADVLTQFSVHLDGRESFLQPVPEEERAELFSSLGIPQQDQYIFTPGGAVGNQLMEARDGVELWMYALGLALACLFLETWLGRGTGQGNTAEAT